MKANLSRFGFVEAVVSDKQVIGMLRNSIAAENTPSSLPRPPT